MMPHILNISIAHSRSIPYRVPIPYRLSFCQQNCRSSLLNCVELCSSQQAPLPNSPNTRPSFSMHNTERCVDQCYQKSEGCVLDCGKSEMTECERTCITKLTQCTAGDSGEDNEKNGEKKEEKRGDGMSIMFSQFKIGHEAKATKGCVLAAGVFDVQSTTKGHFSLAASTTARQHAQTVFTILRRLQVDPLGVIVVEAVNDGMQADGRFELKGALCVDILWERRCLNIVSGVMGLPLPSVSVKKDRVEEKMKGFFEIGALSAKISTQRALKKMLRKTNDILFAFALPSPQLKKKSNVSLFGQLKLRVRRKKIDEKKEDGEGVKGGESAERMEGVDGEIDDSDTDSGEQSGRENAFATVELRRGEREEEKEKDEREEKKTKEIEEKCEKTISATRSSILAEKGTIAKKAVGRSTSSRTDRCPSL
ncbi:hypothetical protein BLNAU_21470 [Blattamonas nauphoetae]|uniref:Uncharacterized protein n=1 Tax=Blattamonas nauphoetae TaxID=2049346 RepID=A0ABQ9WVS7_9EUKA|nr:hypothetical protein BLNAU_21470 [Blattamonas nauphoetae]